jgi:O-antigen/teichoic acid export membrane protein
VSDLPQPPFKSNVPTPLRLNFFWTFLGNVVSQLCMWGIISCYVKIGTAEDAGLYVLGLALAQPIFHFTDFNLRQIFVTDVRNRYDFRSYLAHRFVLTIVGIMSCTGIAFVYYHDSPTLIMVTFFLSLAVAVQSSGEIYHAFFQKQERFDLIAWSMILRGIISLLAVALIFAMTADIVKSLIALFLSRFAVVLFYDYPQAVFLSHSFQTPHFDMKSLAGLTLWGFPLAVNMGVYSFVPQIPRFFLKEYADIPAAGRFGAMAALMSVGLMIVNSLGVSMSQRFARAYHTGHRRDFLRLTLLLTGTALTGGGVALLLIPFLGKRVLSLAYSSEYIALNGVFWWITLGATFGFIGTALGYPVTAARFFKIQPFICFVQLIITFLGCRFWIPEHGMYGAAYAVGVANFFTAVCFAAVWLMSMKKMREQ